MMADLHLCDLVLNRAALGVLRNDGATIKADLEVLMPSLYIVSGDLWATRDEKLHRSPSGMKSRLFMKEGLL